MAITCYLESTGTPAITPAADAGWDVSSGMVRYPGSITTKAGSTLTMVGWDDEVDTDQDIVLAQFIIGPIGAGDVTGDFELRMRGSETGTSQNMFLACVVRVIAPDGSTVRGTALALTRDNTEFVVDSGNPIGNARTRRLTATLTTVTATNGDYVVVDVGAGGNPADGFGGHDYDLRIGSSSASDLGTSETATTDNNPFVLFSTDLPAYTPSGTEYEQSVTGVLAAGLIIGVLTKRANKALSGTQGASTGSLSKQTSRSLSGVAGAFTGAILKQTNKSLSGISGELSGILTSIKTQYISLTGTVGNLTGSLAKQTNKALTGVSGSLSGLINKLISKPLTGIMGDLSGSLNSVRIFLASLSGSVGALTGSLVKQTNKAISGLDGGLTGTVAKSTLKALAGTIGALTGALATGKITALALAGTVGDLTGTLVKQTGKQLTGIVGSLVGSIAKLTSIQLAGIAGSLTGAITKQTNKVLAGVSGVLTGAVSGVIVHLYSQVLDGAISPVGSLVKKTIKSLAGASGALTGAIARRVLGTFFMNAGVQRIIQKMKGGRVI